MKIVAEILITIGLIILLCSIIIPFVDYSCRARWQYSGHQSEFSVFSGCVVEADNGVWIPEKNYIWY
jgi:hypothetical protein